MNREDSQNVASHKLPAVLVPEGKAFGTSGSLLQTQHAHYLSLEKDEELRAIEAELEAGQRRWGRQLSWTARQDNYERFWSVGYVPTEVIGMAPDPAPTLYADDRHPARPLVDTVDKAQAWPSERFNPFSVDVNTSVFKGGGAGGGNPTRERPHGAILAPEVEFTDFVLHQPAMSHISA
eukprot:gnl/TRDRNA2_/TRDRNA2_82320_c0_seq1.p1 gnl/TRDRNA2_/TRDRNA2_82320_c0~~gnl/TRDRNA2_/TRDRNA2_82320_c0_seq1.p1  ORF type:complete len:200 (-),score=18.31 gnl/TRDRNA2_/TRDRNA2_82320_c0_seq1:61-597(-)